MDSDESLEDWFARETPERFILVGSPQDVARGAAMILHAPGAVIHVSGPPGVPETIVKTLLSRGVVVVQSRAALKKILAERGWELAGL